MSRNTMIRLSIATVALVLVLPFTAGCSDTTSGVVQNPIKASFSADADPTDGSVTLQSAGGGGSSDTFKVNVVVGAIDHVNGVAIKIGFNKNIVQFVSGDFTGSFLLGTLDIADFDHGAALFAPGVVDVVAARRGLTTFGIPMAPGDTGVLCTLTFKAIAVTGSGASSFGKMTIDDTDYLITVCTTAGGECTRAAITVGGGSVTSQ